MKSFVAVLRGPDHVFEFVDQAHKESFGDRAVLGKARADVFGELDSQGFAEAPRRAFSTGEIVSMRNKPARFDAGPADQPLQRRLDISYEPMRDARGRVSGLFVRGRDITPIDAHPLEHRAFAQGLTILSDSELLTLMLYHVTLDSTSAEQAEHLLRRFGSLGAVLSASLPSLNTLVPSLQTTSPLALPASAALHLKIAQEVGRRILFGRVASRPVLSSSRMLRAYLRALLAEEPRERFMVLFLDNGLRLIACETMSEGTVAHVAVYTREVVRRAVELSATAMILVHNHPSASRHISESDIAMTAQIERAAAALDIEVIDHLVVAGDVVVSLAEQRLMSASRSRRRRTRS